MWVEESKFGYMVYTKVYVYKYDDVLMLSVDFSTSLMRDYGTVAMVLAAEIMMGVQEREDDGYDE